VMSHRARGTDNAPPDQASSRRKKRSGPRANGDRLVRPEAQRSTELEVSPPRVDEQERDIQRLPQSSTTLYVLLASTLFCVTALVVVAMTNGSATAAGAISAVWAATCGVLGLKSRRES
jgi:hypothetical protein